MRSSLNLIRTLIQTIALFIHYLITSKDLKSLCIIPGYCQNIRSVTGKVLTMKMDNPSRAKSNKVLLYCESSDTKKQARYGEFDGCTSDDPILIWKSSKEISSLRMNLSSITDHVMVEKMEILVPLRSQFTGPNANKLMFSIKDNNATYRPTTQLLLLDK
ncbi:hypothetical protein Tco_0679036 [Tanacetum coccineum]|uniref:Uncharacterized protein n=1 Tax=Tanacetum coccineum TaxID=301880 RepID=A0ABQ4XGW0_9ASTR